MKTWAQQIFLSVFMATAALAGAVRCSAIAERVIEKPKVNLEKVSLQDVGPSGATVIFGVMVDNPNPFALKVDSVRYDVEIGGKPISTGTLEKGAQVAAKSKALVEIPVPVRYQDIFSSMFDFLKNGTSTYRLKGDAAVGPLTIPFDNKGDLKLK